MSWSGRVNNSMIRAITSGNIDFPTPRDEINMVFEKKSLNIP